MQGQSWVWLGATVLVTLFTSSLAGRAFPITAENFVIDLFKKINPSIEWDYTNFLVDLSGYSSKCSAIGQRGTTKPHRFKYHPEFKDSIGGLIDYTSGQYKHVRAVNDYLIKALPSWIQTEPFMTQILKAKYFGCSVRPGCAGQVSFACLFTPAQRNTIYKPPTTTAPPPPTPRPTPRSTTRSTTRATPRPTYPPWPTYTPRPTYPPWPTYTPRPTYPPWPPYTQRPTYPPWPPYTPRPTYPPWPTYTPRPTNPSANPIGVQRALAFTEQQYSMSKQITGGRGTWDSTHFLENLSGYETNCTMIDNPNWQFSYAEQKAQQFRKKVKGICGTAPNKGSTPDGMKEILRAWPPILTDKVGCSVIPDCVRGDFNSVNQMYVVIGCVYEVV